MVRSVGLRLVAGITLPWDGLVKLRLFGACLLGWPVATFSVHYFLRIGSNDLLGRSGPSAPAMPLFDADCDWFLGVCVLVGVLFGSLFSFVCLV